MSDQQQQQTEATRPPANIYTRNGYTDRDDYLDDLACNNGIDRDTVDMIADLLGPNEDFDGLVSSLEDYQEMYC
jgi:hypothetical protein